MASEASVTAVKDAIRSVYLGRNVPRKATARELIATSGVGQKTYYRVLADHPDVAQMLAEYESLFLNRPAVADPESGGDPVKRDPDGALKEALAVIAHLTTVAHQQHKRIKDLENSVQVLVDEQEGGGRPDTPIISAARRRRHETRAGLHSPRDR